MRWKGILRGKRPRVRGFVDARAAIAALLGQGEQQNMLFHSDVAAGRRQGTAGRCRWVYGSAGYIGMT